MENVAVDCVFNADGTVRVRRVQVDGTWRAVDQGRQWQDDAGRHVLVMLPGDRVQELVLHAEDLAWRMKELPGRGPEIA